MSESRVVFETKPKLKLTTKLNGYKLEWLFELGRRLNNKSHGRCITIDSGGIIYIKCFEDGKIAVCHWIDI